MGRQLLLVDDDALLRQTLAEQLAAAEGFSVHQAKSGAEGLAQVQESRFDAILLDVGLPDLDGREVCRQMRALGVNAPIVMLTAAADEADAILGFDSGASDYVTKPFRLGVLLARLRAHIRRHETSEDAAIALGPFVFHPGAKSLQRTEGGKTHKIRLTEKETAILKYLYRADGRVIAREELLHEVWGYNPAVTTHTLETHVYRLRRKIEDDPAVARILATEPGGYRLSLAKS